ncbi:MAG: multidrug transporter [Holophagaceae bacterium]|jgi:hypothetical protein|uniref:Multidrug transporter n=1 Tax=Candidatus Geothrix odensensis TaxID=2954440 RepID=A0A936K545_9BACT|nr:multidrug transporter [Candidatus Geothrix odensensis]MBK8790969.1 multidrug transporter [Holophagaceae bacterium]
MATRVRSSISGQFVKPSKAVTDPKHTVKETIKPPPKKK